MEVSMAGWLDALTKSQSFTIHMHWRRSVCPGLSTQDLQWKHKPYLITRRGSANGATGYRSCKTGLRGKTDRPSLRLWTTSSDFGFRVSSAM
ncbi:hypothetical protein CCHR01_12223 [Colletotrichum chrysophilum]|uniref:Uncharacterized protein n=1 Tax=Colletotrichum chrysophilum TaxID=1836956 RepID=A0AAD9AEJ5_9PEZI|nr:hypothetical protein CCHR01_12223 [Colletotrichum chrysophilum]